MKSLSKTNNDNDLVTVKYLNDNIAEIIGGGIYCNNLIDISKVYTYTNYHKIEKNQYQELVFTTMQTNKRLTLGIEGFDYINQGAFLIQGLIEKNGKPLKTSEWIERNITTEDRAIKSTVQDGYFRGVGSFTQKWFMHAAINMEIGDVFKIKHLQLYKL